MASPTKLFEVKKRPSPFLEDIDLDTCAFCQERFSPERPARNPDKSHLGSLFGACRKRQDDIALRFLDNEQRILDGELTFAYHKDCRSTYTSIWHLERTETSSESIGSDSENTSTETPSKLQHGYETRGNACFNWETDCFVCAKRCGNKKGKRTTWSLVTADADKIYNKVLIAAYLRKDMVVLRRLFSIPGGNLQAAKARYHRGKNCLSSFINERNIRSCTSPDTFTITKEVTDQFINDVKQYIIEEQKVMTLSNIRQQYQDLLSSNRITSTCRSSILKENLKQWLPDILFIERPGLSDLVCSRMITIEDAVCQINLLSKEIEKNVEMLDWQAGGDNNNINNSTKTDEQVIHEAIGILKNRITKSTTSGPSSKQEYFSANELSLESQQKFVDPLLYKALGWLANDELYKTGSDIGESSQPHGRFLSIACDLIYLATSNITPKHLGLAVTLHHHYGSRQLIDMMSSLGYTLPYTEVRHFLTSAARHVNKCHTSASGAYKPPEIASIHQGGGFIVAAADNWDHNEHTVDGKRTTHAMTSILVQSPVGVMQNNNAELRIPRAKEATLNEGDVANFDLAKVEHYKKPKVRPEPAFSPPARVDEILPSSDDPVIHQANILEMVYNMVRSGVFHCTNQNQGISSIPPWGPFHASLSSAANVKSTVAYTPILMAQPSDWSTVYTTLLKLKDSLSSLGQQYAPIYFDMGLLCKALEVTWAKPEELSGVIPCDGGMHLLMSVFGAIGFLYGDAGIKQLLSESGVFAAGTVNNIMSGKDFDRALYALKILDEALSRRFYLQFANWCEDSGHTVSDYLSKLLTELESTFLQCNDKSSLLDKLHQEVTNKLLPLLNPFGPEYNF